MQIQPIPNICISSRQIKKEILIWSTHDFCKNDKRNEQKPLSQLAEYVEMNGIIRK